MMIHPSYEDDNKYDSGKCCKVLMHRMGIVSRFHRDYYLNMFTSFASDIHAYQRHHINYVFMSILLVTD